MRKGIPRLHLIPYNKALCWWQIEIISAPYNLIFRYAKQFFEVFLRWRFAIPFLYLSTPFQSACGAFGWITVLRPALIGSHRHVRRIDSVWRIYRLPHQSIYQGKVSYRPCSPCCSNQNLIYPLNNAHSLITFLKLIPRIRNCASASGFHFLKHSVFGAQNTAA